MEKGLHSLDNRDGIRIYVESYLDRTFRVEDGFVYDHDNNKHFAYDTINDIENVFGFDRDAISKITRDWVESRGVDWDKWNTLKKLKATWSPEMALDLSYFHNIDAEAELAALLTEQISQEIGDQILQNITTLAGVEQRMREIGYVVGPTTYDPNNFTPRKQFIRVE